MAVRNAAAAGLHGRVAAGVFVLLCGLILVMLVLSGIEYPEISGQTAPWYTQPGIIVRIPAIPWIPPSLLGARLLRFTTAHRSAGTRA